MIARLETQSRRYLDLAKARLSKDTVGQRMNGNCRQSHEQGRAVHRQILSHIQMDFQGIGQQRKSGARLRLDLVGELSLIVLVSTSLDRLPREVSTVGKQI